MSSQTYHQATSKQPLDSLLDSQLLVTYGRIIVKIEDYVHRNLQNNKTLFSMMKIQKNHN